MHTFTREFYRPNDRIRQVSADAASRFEEDHRRFPPGSYEEHSLVWKQDRWRQLCPEERAQLLGMPPEAVSAVRGSEARQTQGRNSLLGNGFHIPSLLAIFMMLPAILDAKLVLAPSAPDLPLRSCNMGTAAARLLPWIAHQHPDHQRHAVLFRGHLDTRAHLE